MAEKLFLVEGAKAVLETLQSDWQIAFLVVTPAFFEAHQTILKQWEKHSFIAGKQQLAQLSHFETNDAVLAVVHQKDPGSAAPPEEGLWLAVEAISDPGNLGTIIRLADWFGLRHVVCLGDCVEWYNPKVVASTMGSFLRIHQVKISMNELLTHTDRQLVAAHMQGTSLYHYQFPAKTCLVIGNEANGLTERMLQKASGLVSIPRFGQAESLNAAMATGILLNHWRMGQRSK